MEKIEVNPNREYYFALDISASMSATDLKCDGLSRYQYVLDKFKKFAKIAEEYDQHEGITVFLFGEKVQMFPETKFENVSSKLDKVDFEGQTNLHLLLNDAFDQHLKEKRDLANEKKPCIGTQLLVFTDGEPSNRARVSREIVRIANSIDREDEFNITFLTVGTISRELKQYLDGLHDNIKNEIKAGFDIIHIMEADNTDFIKAVGASLHK